MSQDTGTIPADRKAEERHSAWRGLYSVGGVAALIATVLFFSDIVVLVALSPAPSTASGWFMLLEENRALGIIQLFFTDLIGVALLFPIVLALYGALRRSHKAYMTLAAALAIAGIAIVFATNTNYGLLNLSSQYAAATTEAQRSQLLAAGESLLATALWGTGPLVAPFLLEGALLIISVIMVQSSAFGKGLGYLGILAHGLDAARSVVFLILMPVASADLALAVGTPLLAIGGTLQLIWYPWLGWRLLQLRRQTVPD